MMKKLLLFLAVGVIANTAIAQKVEGVENPNNTVKISKPADNYNYVDVGPKPDFKNRSAKKTTAASPRWYVPYDIINSLNNNVMDNNRSFIPMWFDSTITIKYSNNPTPTSVNFASVGQVVDPIGVPGQMFNDPAFNGSMWVNNFDTYTVDSIVIAGAYVKSKTRPTGVVDTLILSVAPQSGFRYYLKSTSTWAATYLPSGKDTLAVFVPKADSINRAAFSNVGDSVANRKMWKVPLFDADRDTVNTQNNTITVRTRVFAVPGGGLSIPANSRVSITATFKSGDTWTPNSVNDTIQGHHYYRPQSADIVDGGAMQYNYYSTIRDRNHSSLMFTTNTGSYAASVGIEGTNAASFSYEHHMLGAHIVCSSCWVLDVKNTAGLLAKGGAYPNPSTSFVNIPFQLTSAANVNVTLTNALGQVVRSEMVQNVTNGEVTFNTSNLNNGLYLYTIEVNGQRTTGRVTVAH